MIGKTHDTKFVEWLFFTASMAIVVLAPERIWWALALYVIAGVLMSFNILKQRRRSNVS